MTKTRALVVALFLIAFASGLCTALVARPPQPPPERGPSWLASELNLSAEQKQEMLKIWGSLGRPSGQEDGDRRREFQKQRDDAVRQLVPTDKQTELEAIFDAYARQMADLAEQRHRGFEAAVEKTKAILTPEQRTKYEQVLARRAEGRRQGGPGRDRPPGGPHGPATAPAPSVP